MFKAIGAFIGLYFAIVIVVFGIPLGLLAFVLGRFVYGSWYVAGQFYLLHLCSAGAAFYGLIPVYGNKLHYLLVTNQLLPLFARHGVTVSWLLSLSGSLAGCFAAMCPGALVFRIYQETKGSVPGVVLLLGAAVMLAGTIWSVSLFF